MEEKTNSLKNLLQNVAIIQKKYDDLAEYSGEHYNVFDILGVQSDELSHSAILTNLLDAKGKHGQKNVFLKLFINQIKPLFKDENRKLILDDFKTNNSSATKEKHVGKVDYDKEEGGRIDIVVNDGINNIIIENKVYAGDQPLQLVRYFEFDKKAPILYLTLDGKEPSDNSKGKLTVGMEYICISYKYEILEWLENCIKEMVNKPIIRETLNQYLFLIKSITNQSNNDKMSDEILEIMLKNIGGSFEIYKNYPKLKITLFNSFIEKIKSKFSNELIVQITENIGSKNTSVTFIKNNWNDIGIELYFEGNNFSDVIIGISEKIINSITKDNLVDNFKTINFGRKIYLPNWYVLYSYNTFNNINSAEFWININSENFINSFCDDLNIFIETIDKALDDNIKAIL